MVGLSVPNISIVQRKFLLGKKANKLQWQRYRHHVLKLSVPRSADFRALRTCLRISGDDLVPEEITQVLRCTPTVAQRTGELIRYQSGRERVVKCGNWRLEAEPAEPEDVNGQVRWLLSQVESDPKVWKALVHRFDVDIFCGLFMQGSNDGMSLAPDVMALLGERGIHPALDIYNASDDDDVTPSQT